MNNTESRVISGALCLPKTFPHLLAVALESHITKLFPYSAIITAPQMMDGQMDACMDGWLDTAQSFRAVTLINCPFVHNSPFLI